MSYLILKAFVYDEYADPRPELAVIELTDATLEFLEGCTKAWGLIKELDTTQPNYLYWRGGELTWLCDIDIDDFDWCVQYTQEDWAIAETFPKELLKGNFHWDNGPVIDYSWQGMRSFRGAANIVYYQWQMNYGEEIMCETAAISLQEIRGTMNALDLVKADMQQRRDIELARQERQKQEAKQVKQLCQQAARIIVQELCKIYKLDNLEPFEGRCEAVQFVDGHKFCCGFELEFMDYKNKLSPITRSTFVFDAVNDKLTLSDDIRRTFREIRESRWRADHDNQSSRVFDSLPEAMAYAAFGTTEPGEVLERIGAENESNNI